MERSDIWEPEVLVEHIRDTFDPMVFKVILGSFGALVSSWPLIRKLMGVQREEMKICTRGLNYDIHVYEIACPMSFWDHLIWYSSLK